LASSSTRRDRLARACWSSDSASAHFFLKLLFQGLQFFDGVKIAADDLSLVAGEESQVFAFPEEGFQVACLEEKMHEVQLAVAVKGDQCFFNRLLFLLQSFSVPAILFSAR